MSSPVSHLLDLIREQAQQDFLKEAVFLGSAWDVVKTPFKNMSEGYSDWSAARKLKDQEIEGIGTKLRSSGVALNTSNPDLKSNASKLWKSEQEGYLSSIDKLKETPELYGPQANKNTLYKIREARGRMIGGALQVGVPATIGALALKNRGNKEGA